MEVDHDSLDDDDLEVHDDDWEEEGTWPFLYHPLVAG